VETLVRDEDGNERGDGNMPATEPTSAGEPRERKKKVL
jgi:hypothetical protein